MLSPSTSHHHLQPPSLYYYPPTSASSPQLSTGAFPSGSPSPQKSELQMPSTASSTATSFSDQSQSSNTSSSTSNVSEAVGYSNLFNSGMDNLANLRKVGTGKSSKFAFLPGKDRKSTFRGSSRRSKDLRPMDSEGSGDGHERRWQPEDDRALTSSNNINHGMSSSLHRYYGEPFERKSTPTEASSLATGSKAARILGVDFEGVRRNSYDSQSTRDLLFRETSIKATKSQKIVREKSVSRKLQKSPPGGKDGDRGSLNRGDTSSYSRSRTLSSNSFPLDKPSLPTAPCPSLDIDIPTHDPKSWTDSRFSWSRSINVLSPEEALGAAKERKRLEVQGEALVLMSAVDELDENFRAPPFPVPFPSSSRNLPSTRKSDWTFRSDNTLPGTLFPLPHSIAIPPIPPLPTSTSPRLRNRPIVSENNSPQHSKSMERTDPVKSGNSASSGYRRNQRKNALDSLEGNKKRLVIPIPPVPSIPERHEPNLVSFLDCSDDDDFDPVRSSAFSLPSDSASSYGSETSPATSPSSPFSLYNRTSLSSHPYAKSKPSGPPPPIPLPLPPSSSFPTIYSHSIAPTSGNDTQSNSGISMNTQLDRFPIPPVCAGAKRRSLGKIVEEQDYAAAKVLRAFMI